jgi:peptidoglycan/LPS O-acetylase OafA/YrhL
MTSSSVSVASPVSASAAPVCRRMFSVELLRLLAICGIAVFHAFLPTFEQIVALGPQASVLQGGAGAPVSDVALLAASRPLVWALALLQLLGSWGNHVFFMISGFFLIPSAAERSCGPCFWSGQVRSTAWRVVKVVAAVAFYALIFVAVNRWIMPVADAGSVWWVTYNIEFVWLYMFFIALAPLIGWVAARCGKRWQAWLAGGVLLVLYAFNVYVALTSRGDFGQLTAASWRKQIGAVSYFASFILAGVLGIVIRRARRSEEAEKSCGSPAKRAVWMSRGFWLSVIGCVVALAMLIAAVFAMRGDYVLLSALSFKSTSPISFVLAVAALMVAVCPRGVRNREAGTRFVGKGKALIETLASGILGYYIAQALGYGVMRVIQTRLTASALSHASAAALAGSTLECAGWQLAWCLCAIVAALALVVIICLLDRLIRQPLLRQIKLA